MLQLPKLVPCKQRRPYTEEQSTVTREQPPLAPRTLEKSPLGNEGQAQPNINKYKIVKKNWKQTLKEVVIHPRSEQYYSQTATIWLRVH